MLLGGTDGDAPRWATDGCCSASPRRDDPQALSCSCNPRVRMAGRGGAALQDPGDGADGTEGLHGDGVGCREWNISPHPSTVPVAPLPPLARGDPRRPMGGPLPHPTGAEDPTPGLQRGKPSHCEYLRPVAPSPSRDPKLALGAARRRSAQEGSPRTRWINAFIQQMHFGGGGVPPSLQGYCCELASPQTGFCCWSTARQWGRGCSVGFGGSAVPGLRPTPHGIPAQRRSRGVGSVIFILHEMQTGRSTLGCGGVLFFKALVLILGFFFFYAYLWTAKKRGVSWG